VRTWVVFASVVLGAVAGFVGWLAYKYPLSNEPWRVPVALGAAVGLLVGLMASTARR
jgi:hypothetical protein